jgi:feruloyl esterase
MKRTFLFVTLALCLSLAAWVVPHTGAANPPEAPRAQDMACESLKDLKLPGVTITVAESVNPIEESPGVTVHGVWKSPDSAFGSATVPVPFCRVAGLVEPAINFEVWMPPADAWNGKLNGVGNGALAGGINYGAMVGPLTMGYAAASTDGGHQRPAPVLGDWILGNPELWDDFGYRAIHVMTRNAQAIIEAYYGQAPEYSYFTGCSGGGQQGLVEAQKYPADYDGIIVGAPANFPTRMWPGETWPSYVTHRDADSAIPVEKLPLINQAALAACDTLDGVEDGLLEDPRLCDFDPATLLCEGDDAPDCLTAGQVDSVQKVYEGLKDPTTGEQFWPGYEPGSELDWPGHIGEPFIIPQGYFKGMVFEDADWDWTTFNFEDPEDFAILYDADARYAPHINATDPDLSAFNELGGKLILWHGWSDQKHCPAEQHQLLQQRGG